MFFLLPVFIVIGLILHAVDQIEKVALQQNMLIPVLVVFAFLPLCIAICVYGAHYFINRNPRHAEQILSFIVFLPYIFFAIIISKFELFNISGDYLNVLIKYIIGSKKNLEESLSFYLPLFSTLPFIITCFTKIILLALYYLIFSFYVKVYDFFHKKGQKDYQTFALPEFFDLNKVIIIGFIFLFFIELISVGADWQDNYLNNLLLQQNSDQIIRVYLICFLQVALPLLLPLVLIIIIPLILPMIVGWRPLPKGEVLTLLEKTAKQNNFRYRKIYLAPKPGLVTAGVIGVFPWATNLVFTRDILNLLNEDEIEAVMLHEIGHVKHLHLVSYFSLFSVLQLLIIFLSILLLPTGGSESIIFIFSLLILLTGIRFGWGWLSRHCERQADLHAAEVQGHPNHLITSFLKISSLGIPLDKPSWHHGSLRTRIHNLAESFSEDGEIKRKKFHKKLGWIKFSVVGCFLLFVMAVAAFKAYIFTEKEIIKIYSKYQIAMNLFQEKKYAESSQKFDEVKEDIEKIDVNQSADSRDLYRHLKLIALYNNACALALLGKQENAVQNLLATIPLYKKSDMEDILSEGLNVKKVNSDPDLNSLRERDDFKEFIKALENKEKELGVVTQ